MSINRLKLIHKEVKDACNSLESLIEQISEEHRGIMQFANIDVDELVNTLQTDLIELRAYLEEIEVKIRLTELAST